MLLLLFSEGVVAYVVAIKNRKIFFLRIRCDSKKKTCFFFFLFFNFIIFVFFRADLFSRVAFKTCFRVRIESRWMNRTCRSRPIGVATWTWTVGCCLACLVGCFGVVSDCLFIYKFEIPFVFEILRFVLFLWRCFGCGMLLSKQQQPETGDILGILGQLRFRPILGAESNKYFYWARENAFEGYEIVAYHSSFVEVPSLPMEKYEIMCINMAKLTKNCPWFWYSKMFD